ncbi:MAG: flagellar motor switch protein FliG [Chthoniobacter sp.]|jgi:flagellar motor switch protein FliG|nr:flagellar motor switch protein FliG [Chthoniobacter sp.]
MPSLDYAGLSKPQKTAAFMVLIGAESAAVLLRHFDDIETEAIVREMANLPLVDQEAQKALMEEFTELIGNGMSSALGGLAYAKQTLDLARGPQLAANILQRAIPPSSSIDAVRKLSMMEPRQIFNLIKAEQPQTIAFVLSYLDTVQAAEIVPLLSDEKRDDVVQRLADMEPTSLDLVSKVMSNLNQHVDARQQQQALSRRGGAESAANLLNRLESKMGKAILSKIDERNAALGTAIRRKMFTFEDFGRVSSPDLQRILREVETRDLAISLKSARDNLKKTFYAGMSKRAAEGLREEMEMLGPVRMKDVEAAQDRLIAAARALEEKNEITLVEEEANAVVT